jgi:dihydrofolate reductase
MNLSLVVAASTNNVIGVNNELPWHLPNDLRFFKNTTWAMPVLMGRNTFESMKSKPLNGRVNLVMTTQKEWKAEGVLTIHSLKDAILFAHENDYKEIMVIGGAKVFEQTIGSACDIYLTRVHTTLEGDVFFS